MDWGPIALVAVTALGTLAATVVPSWLESRRQRRVDAHDYKRTIIVDFLNSVSRLQSAPRVPLIQQASVIAAETFRGEVHPNDAALRELRAEARARLVAVRLYCPELADLATSLVGVAVAEPAAWLIHLRGFEVAARSELELSGRQALPVSRRSKRPPSRPR